MNCFDTKKSSADIFRTGQCYSKTMDLCDFHNDCKDKDDEENTICGEQLLNQ